MILKNKKKPAAKKAAGKPKKVYPFKMVFLKPSTMREEHKDAIAEIMKLYNFKTATKAVLFALKMFAIHEKQIKQASDLYVNEKEKHSATANDLRNLLVSVSNIERIEKELKDAKLYVATKINSLSKKIDV